MSCLRCCFLVVACLFAPVLGAREAVITLRSSELEVVVDPAGGCITGIRDTVRDLDLISPDTEPSWLAKLRYGDNWSGVWDGELTQTRVGTDADGRTRVRLAYSVPVGEGVAAVTMTVSCGPDRPDIAFVLEAQGPEEGPAIDGLFGPEIVLPKQMPGGGATRAFLGAGDGVETVADGLDGFWSVREYPGGLAMQVCAYYSDSTGLAMAARDTEGHPKVLGVSCNRKFDPKGVHYWMERKIPAEPGAGAAPYPVVIYPVRDGWRSAVEPYRDWALKQWWAQPKPEGQRSPAWTRKGAIAIESNLDPQYCGLRTMPPAAYPAVLEGWADALGGATLMTLFRNFERYGVYGSPHYWPLRPSEAALRSLCADIHGAGHHTMAMVSGLVWQISRPEYAGGPAYWVNGIDGKIDGGGGTMVDGWSEVSPSGPEVCVVTRDGSIARRTTNDWGGTRSHMCPGHAYQDREACYPRQLLVRLATDLARLGVDVFEIDQMNGGKTPPCYSSVHGHPKGFGRWQAETVGEIMAACRAAGRAHNPDFVVDMEDPGELFLPHLDMFGCRPAAINGWPALSVGDGTRPQSYTVPAFAFVYGHLMRSHAWDQNQNVADNTFNLSVPLVETAKTASHGANVTVQLAPWQLVNAHAPPPEGWTKEDGPYAGNYPDNAIAQRVDRAHALHLALLRNAALTMNGVALPYLNEGRMIHISPVIPPTFTHSVWNHKEQKAVERTDWAVYHNAWAKDDGRILFLAFSADHQATRALPLPAEFDHAVVSADRQVRVSVNGETAGTVASGDLGGKVDVPPLAAVALEIMP